jgi:hypothetical protein
LGESLQEGSEKGSVVEANKSGGSIAHEYFDRVVHLAELSVKDLFDLPEVYNMLCQVFFYKVLLRGSSDKYFIVSVGRPVIFRLESELSFC